MQRKLKVLVIMNQNESNYEPTQAKSRARYSNTYMI